ncbi:MAG: hypothetical protein GY861_17135 [bacterium]|nr:hypothetical protein [bacterium]
MDNIRVVQLLKGAKENEKLIAEALGAPDMTMEEMKAFEEEKYYVARGMMAHDCNFFRLLGDALAHADIPNSKKIQAVWPQHWKENHKIGKEAYDRENLC